MRKYSKAGPKLKAVGLVLKGFMFGAGQQGLVQLSNCKYLSWKTTISRTGQLGQSLVAKASSISCE